MRAGYKMTKLGEIPEDWEVVKLGEIAKVERGKFQHRPRNDPKFYGGSYPFVQTGDVAKSNGKIIKYSQTLNELGIGVSRLFPKGTIVITIAANIGDTAIAQFEIAFPDSLIGIIVKENIDNIFIRHYLVSQKKNLNKLSTISAQKNINLETLKPYKIPLPPLQEQKKIAQILSTVDEKIDLTQSKIETTQALKKGLMQQLLTKGIGHTAFKESKLGEIPKDWEVVKLGNILDKIKGGGTPTRDVDDYWNGKVPWATVKDLKNGILNDIQEYISQKGLKESSANLIPKWTLIIATRMALGKAVFFTKDVAINQDLKALYTKDTLDKMYLFHWFFSNSNQILELGSGSTVKGIRLEVLKAISFLLPPLQEQKKIAQILSTVDEKIDLLQEKKKAYQAMKKGLMQQLLTGQVRVP